MYIQIGLFVSVAVAAALPEQVKTEYPQALAALQSRYARVRGSGTWTVLDKKTKAQTRFKVSFAFDGSSKRVMAVRVDEGAAGDNRREQVFCVKPDHSFSLARAGDDKPYRVTNLGDRAAVEGRIRLMAGQFVDAPFAEAGLPIGTILADSSNKVVSVDEVKADDDRGRWVRIELEERARGGLVDRGWVVVDPSHAWVTRHGEIRHKIAPAGSARKPPGGDSPDELKTVYRVDYAGGPGGTPVPSKVVYDVMGKQLHTFTFKELKFAPSDTREFTMAGYGFPDLDADTESAPADHSLFWTLAIAAGAAVTSGFMKYASGRCR